MSNTYPYPVLARGSLVAALSLGGCLGDGAVGLADGSPTFNHAPVAPSTGSTRAKGQVMVLFGQSSPDLSQFRAEVLDARPSFPRPSGITLYTNIVPGACSGLDGPCDLGGNVNDFGLSLGEYPDGVLSVGLYLSDSYAGCTNQPLRALIGQDDPDLTDGLGQQYRDELDTLITYLGGTGRDVLLRIGYEFDGPWNCYNNELYIQAFQYVSDRIDALGATNIAKVWQSATYAQDGDPTFHYDFTNPDHFDVWYPGDEYVDWVGISTFSWDDSYEAHQWSCGVPTTNPQFNYDNALDFAREHDKPVIIAESTPQAYRTADLDAGCIFGNFGSTAVDADQIWSDWYAPLFQYVHDNDDVIAAVAYINSDWEAIAQFNCAPGAGAGDPTCTDGYWGNSRIQDDALILELFAAEMAELLEGDDGGNGEGSSDGEGSGDHGGASTTGGASEGEGSANTTAASGTRGPSDDGDSMSTGEPAQDESGSGGSGCRSTARPGVPGVLGLMMVLLLGGRRRRS